MNISNLKYILILIIELSLPTYECFFPSRYIDIFLSQIENRFKLNLDEISKTISHEQMLKTGLLRSVRKYFSNQANGFKINKTKEYSNIRDIFYDYYGIRYCSIEFEDILRLKLNKNVAKIDLDPSTRKMPYAHFDSEAFLGSNQRIIDFNNNISEAIEKKDYDTARNMIGQVLHTIQDFYSHSNWVEMGYINQINELIGTESFLIEPVAKKNESTCKNNCLTLYKNCTFFVKKLSELISMTGYKPLKCPLVYYKCKNNIKTLNKLVSGYSVNQKLPDGTPIKKPFNMDKCSHGGILDNSSNTNAFGGINKDSGSFLFSPHADLHLIAANLSIQHTEYYFENLRKKIGDEIYSDLLGLNFKSGFWNKINQFFHFC